MDNTLSSAERIRLRRRESELLQKIDRLRKAMNETKDLNTLAFKSKLLKEAQEELSRVQEKLSGTGPQETT
jgi:ferritin